MTHQSRMWRAAAVAAILTAGAFAWRAGAQGGAEAPATPVIATVNIERLINNLEEKAHRQSKLEEYRQRRLAKLEQMQSDLQAAAAELEVIPSDSEQFREQIEKVERLRLLLEAEDQFAQQQIDSRKGAIFRTLFEKIRAASESYAAQNGYDLVLSDDSGVAVQRGGEQQVTRQIAALKLLYTSDRLDITDAILQKLNSEFRGAD